MQSNPNTLGFHPLTDDNIESSEDPIRKAIALLLTRKKPYETIYLSSPEGLRLMHLRYEADEKAVHKICLMFKRSPELKPYYKAIKSWCEDNDLQWKGKVFDHNRYMEIALNPYLDKITETIFDAKQTIFKVKTVSVGTQSHDLSLAIQGDRHLILIAFFGLASVVALGLLPLYELFRVPYLGKPSFNAVDWPEIFLITALVIGLFSLRKLIQTTVKNNRHKRKPRVIARAALLLLVATVFFTY